MFNLIILQAVYFDETSSTAREVPASDTETVVTPSSSDSSVEACRGPAADGELDRAFVASDSSKESLILAMESTSANTNVRREFATVGHSLHDKPSSQLAAMEVARINSHRKFFFPFLVPIKTLISVPFD